MIIKEGGGIAIQDAAYSGRIAVPFKGILRKSVAKRRQRLHSKGRERYRLSAGEPLDPNRNMGVDFRGELLNTSST